jgi:leucyl/phenylalanyl-tRNA--protein transferase
LHFLTEALYFPNVTQTDKFGLLAVGGDLSAERLMLAYRSGIFPWFEEGEPILWWSPKKRMVLYPNEIVVSKSMRNIINRNVFEVTFNQNFREVISNCQRIKREGQDGTWITDAMVEAYCKLYELGYAKSVEVWQDGHLVGGLYGIDLGTIFCGESMFSKVPNASKMGFIALAKNLKANHYQLLDCQLHNNHLESLGCREITRDAFMKVLQTK